MRADEDVFVAGEDVAAYGGVFRTFRGLLDGFGPRRVVDTPISETALMGLDVGAAARGLRPVVGIMYMDFRGVCMDQILNQAAKMRYMFGGSVRRVIAQRMHASLTEMAQLTHGCEATMDAVIALRGRLKEDLHGTDIPVPSLTDFVLRAAALALRDHPLLNARVEDDGIHVLSAINAALAIAVPDGLIAPVVIDAASKPVTVLAAETSRLAAAARRDASARPARGLHVHRDLPRQLWRRHVYADRQSRQRRDPGRGVRPRRLGRGHAAAHCGDHAQPQLRPSRGRRRARCRVPPNGPRTPGPADPPARLTGLHGCCSPLISAARILPCCATAVRC
jgi:hypothetical protein